MKFDFIIGNPPYQEVAAIKETKNGQKRVKSIFQHFQEQGELLANECTVFIYPGRRWIHQAGKGMQKFGLNQINDSHLKRLIFYPDAREVFSNVDISDGISIVVKDMKKRHSGFNYTYIKDGEEKNTSVSNPGDKLMPLNPDDVEIIQKISDTVSSLKVKYLYDSILSQKLFGIESSFVEENPDKVRPYEEGDLISEKECKLFTNDRAGSMGRAKWYIADRETIGSNASYIDEWQVVVSSANAGGQKRDNQIAIVDNQSAFGRARVALKSFKTEKEAQNFFKYATSYLIKYAFLMTDESLSSLAKWVPDILDYTDSNEFIDFSRDVNDQLYKLFQLTKNEISYIETRVENQRKK